MRYLASEKAEIIELVEQSHLPAKRTLDKLGIPRATFYRWYDRYRAGGPEALPPQPARRPWERTECQVGFAGLELRVEMPGIERHRAQAKPASLIRNSG
jgi:putative transposase